ncbi:MAG: hypothetical protein JJV90_01805 [Spiroplasma sp.]|nr:hypothetical protein [Mycoplasmatales bacterium]
MKKLLIFLITILIAGSLFVVYLNNDALSQSIYGQVENIKTLTQEEDEYIVYFTSQSCGYCEGIEEDVIRFNDALLASGSDVKLYLMDMSDPKNAQNYYKTEESIYNEDHFDYIEAVPEDFVLEDYRIGGVPAAVYIKDGKVTQIGSGTNSAIGEDEEEDEVDEDDEDDEDEVQDPPLGCLNLFKQIADQEGFEYIIEPIED